MTPFKGYCHEVFIPWKDWRPKNRPSVTDNMEWLLDSLGAKEGLDYYWIQFKDPDRGDGDRYFFIDPNHALMFKLARGGIQ